MLTYTDSEVSIGKELERVIVDNGFVINRSKVRLCTPNQRHEVTGLTINKFPNVKRFYIRHIQSMLYAWEKFGEEPAKKHYEKKYADTHRLRASNSLPSFRYVLQGKINYLKMVRGKADPIYRKLAYRYSICIGKPKKFLQEDGYDKITNALYVLYNHVDENHGTAFMLKGVGLVTCNHVVESLKVGQDINGLLDVYSGNNPEKTLTLEIVEKFSNDDIAILKIIDKEKKEHLQYNLQLSDNLKFKTGDKITIWGFPEHLKGDSPYYESCAITQEKKNYLEIKNVYMISGTVVHGMSGGPVLNQANEVIGIIAFGRENISEAKKTIFNGFIPWRIPLKKTKV